MKSWPAILFCASWMAWAADEKPAVAPQPQTQTPAPPKDKSLPSARAVIDRYVEAAGGKDAFFKHNSVLIKGKTEVAGKDLGGGMTLATAKPNKMALTVDLAGIAIRTGFDGKVGWQVNPITGPSIMEGAELRDVSRQADFFSILHDNKGYKSMENLGKIDFEGEECYKIKLTYADGGDITEYYSVKTGLQKGFVGSQESSLGTINATSVNEEHKKFGDLLLPSRVTQKMAGSGIAQTMVIDSVEYDHVPDSMFEPPAEIKAMLNAEKQEKADSEKKPAEKKAPVEKTEPAAPKKVI
jgi:zinc protease